MGQGEADRDGHKGVLLRAVCAGVPLASASASASALPVIDQPTKPQKGKGELLRVDEHTR